MMTVRRGRGMLRMLMQLHCRHVRCVTAFDARRRQAFAANAAAMFLMGLRKGAS